eukprot:SAG11_NODE_11904_length_732_cov_1.647709_2_plen_90_part_01
MVPPTLCLDETFVPDFECALAEDSGRRSLLSANATSTRCRLGHIPTPNCETFDDYTEPNCKFSPAETTAALNSANWQEFTFYFWSKGPNL